MNTFLSPVKCKCGNGGFSIRRISSTVLLLKKYWMTVKLWGYAYNEDFFFSYFAYNKKYKCYRGLPLNKSYTLCFDFGLRGLIEQGELPYAVHAWHRDFSLEEIKCYISD